MRAGRNVDPDTVADILAHAEWPAERLWLVMERWQPAAGEGEAGERSLQPGGLFRDHQNLAGGRQ